MSESGDWLIDRAIKKATIDPIRVEIVDDQLGEGMIYRARRTGHFAAARKFGQLWKVETDSDSAPDCLPAEDSHLYLICDPLLHSGSARIAIGSLGVKTSPHGSYLEWIWLHPHFRRAIMGQQIATESLKAVSQNHPVFEMNESGSEISKQRMAKLWNRAFPKVVNLEGIR